MGSNGGTKGKQEVPSWSACQSYTSVIFSSATNNSLNKTANRLYTTVRNLICLDTEFHKTELSTTVRVSLFLKDKSDGTVLLKKKKKNQHEAISLPPICHPSVKTDLKKQ